MASLKRVFTWLRLIPVWAYPSVIRHALGRRLRSQPIPAAELTDAELDFFFGSTEAVDRVINNYSFKLFDSFASPSAEELENILKHLIEFFGTTFEVGTPLQWRRDFQTGYEWPREHISKLPLVTQKGDVKIPWELSRFQHGTKLALGYRRTHDQRFANEWLAQFNAWRADNPPECGPNWGNAMEASIRAVNWLLSFHFLREALDRPAQESIFKALIQHGRFIFTHLEEFFPFNNHLIADLCGLIWLGSFFHPTPEAQRWLDYGLRELAHQLRIQVLPDGTSYEASTAYHCLVTEMLVSTFQMLELNQDLSFRAKRGISLTPPRDSSRKDAARNDISLDKLRETANKMLQVLNALRKPDGSLPLFGDEDGGTWIANYQLPAASRQPPATSHWYIYRHADEYLAIRAGDNGQLGWGGHAHNDALSFEYSIGIRNFLIDPGTYTYTADPASRNLFRSTAYHNTLRVDGQEISRIPEGELFRLEDDVRCHVSTQNDSMWEGEHTGYKRLGLTHRRRFEKTAAGWLIRDTVSGDGTHSLEWFFHFNPGCAVEIDQNRVITQFSRSPNIQITSHLPSLRPALQQEFVSPTYGQRTQALTARYVMMARLPIDMEFLITRF